MKTLILIALSILFFQGFAKNRIGYSFNSDNEIPIVQSDSTYKVFVKKDIVYAKGLSHESINSVSSKEMSLKLDVYLPDNKLNKSVNEITSFTFIQCSFNHKCHA